VIGSDIGGAKLILKCIFINAYSRGVVASLIVVAFGGSGAVVLAALAVHCVSDGLPYVPRTRRTNGVSV